MNIEVAIVAVSERGIQVAVGDDAAFWLPKSAPGLVWSATPEVGSVVYVRVPNWIVTKHNQLAALRYQRSLSFHQPIAGLDPAKAEGSLPMSDYPQDIGEGALFKNRDKTKPSQPDYFGRAEVQGLKLRVSAWLKDSKKNPGQKFMSLSFRIDDTQQQPGQQQRPAGGQSFGDESIPFLPDR